MNHCNHHSENNKLYIQNINKQCDSNNTIRNEKEINGFSPPPSPGTEINNDHRILHQKPTSSEFYSRSNKIQNSLDSENSEQESIYISDGSVPSRPVTIHAGDTDALDLGTHNSYMTPHSASSSTTGSSALYATSLPNNSPCGSSVYIPHDFSSRRKTSTREGGIQRMSTSGSIPRELFHQSQEQIERHHNYPRPHRWRRVKDWILTPASKNRKTQKNQEAMEAERAAFDPCLFYRQLEWNILPPFLLSSRFQTDEHDHHMIPILISQIRISVTRPNERSNYYAQRKRKNLLKRTRNRLYAKHHGSTRTSIKDKKQNLHYNSNNGNKKELQDAHMDSNKQADMFKIVVEYGNTGDNSRLRASDHNSFRWVVYRSYWDFLRLHYHFLSHDILKKRNITIPRLPRLHQVRRPGHRNTTWQRSTLIQRHLAEKKGLQEKEGHQVPQQHYRLSEEQDAGPSTTSSTIQQQEQQQQSHQSQYMSTGNNLWISPQINRFCKFLEISKLGLSLCISDPEGYHGKEGYLTIVNQTDRQIVRRHRDRLFCGLLARHESKRIPRWFIVRESYIIVCAGGPDKVSILIYRKNSVFML
ncbi:hypothetical protein BDC45DRAFT_502467 [Circinella umbellata]|nr:hypothetical protein BDC45DRAFT_502467 [Circinella umbellata]